MPAGAIAGSGVLSAGASLFGSSQASRSQTRAAETAARTQMAMYNQTRADLEPFRNVGIGAGNALTNRLAELTSPIIMDQDTVERTPGYRFTLNAGLRAGQSSAAARGLGLSGAAIKAASGYATGLADQTWQNQFNNANTNQTNAFNRLLQATQLGGNAAAQTGTAGTITGQGVATSQTGAGNAAGAGAIAGSNAIGAGANALAQYFARNGGTSGGNRLTGLYDDPDLSGFRSDQWV